MFNKYSKTLKKAPFFMALLCSSAMVWGGHQAFAQDMVGAALQNSTAQTVDYYVLLSDGSSQYVGTLSPGQSISEEFYPGEVIMVTPEGTDSILQQFTFDGTPNAVLKVQDKAGPPNVTGPRRTGGNINDVPQNAEEPEKPEVIISDAFKQWLKTDYVNHSPREPNKTAYQDGFQDKFRLEGPVRKGYNIKKMDPSDLTQRGLNGNAPTLIAPLTGTSVNWGIRELLLAMPNDLILLSEQARTDGEESTAVMFSSEEERKSTSVNVGLGVSAGGGGKEGAGPKVGASGRVGVTNSKTKFESNSDTLIRKQIIGQAYWVTYAKEYMKLSPEFSAFLSDKNSLNSTAKIERFFEEYGTHWPVATLFGGYIRLDETMSATEFGETISQSLSVSASANIPVKAATVSPSVGFEKSNETSTRQKEQNGKVTFHSRGGNPGSSYLNWSMATPSQADKYVPLKVELRGIHELIWPELMDVTDPEEAQRIHDLRVRVAKVLEDYTRAVPVDNSDWSPRIYEASYESITVDKVDDEGDDEEMEFFGEGNITPTGKPRVGAVSVWDKGSDTPSRSKGYEFVDANAKKAYLVHPARAKRHYVNGRIINKPEFDTSGEFKFHTWFHEYDSTSANETMDGEIKVSIQEIESHPKKRKTITRYYSDDGEGVKVVVSVRRLNYSVQNDPPELLPLPGMRRLGEGDAIASKPVGGSGRKQASTGSSSGSRSNADNRSDRNGSSGSGSPTSTGSNTHKYTMIKSALGTCLGATGVTSQSNVVSMHCNANDSRQKWRISGKNIIHSSGKCLNTMNADQNVTIWNCSGNTNKQWIISGQRIKNVKFNKCLDVARSSREDGANVLAWQCTTNPNQKWNY